MATLRVQVKGARSILEHLDRDELIGPPWKTFLEKSTLTLESEARIHVPKWRRVLMNSIEREIGNDTFPLEAKVGILRGPALQYARAMHDGRRKGKFPPLAAIAEWANSKGIGIPPFVIARAIARGRSRHQRKGGSKYLTKAVASARPKITGFLDRMARDIEDRWRHRA